MRVSKITSQLASAPEGGAQSGCKLIQNACILYESIQVFFSKDAPQFRQEMVIRPFPLGTRSSWPQPGQRNYLWSRSMVWACFWRKVRVMGPVMARNLSFSSRLRW